MNFDQSKFHKPKSVIGIFGKYKIGKPLGSGGNGKVFEVKVSEENNDQLPDNCAIKFFNPCCVNDTEKRKERFERFNREIEITKKLNGKIKGIMPIFDSSCSNDLNQPSWYLMPKADRYSFNKPLDILINDMISLCNSIRLLHDFGCAHRDIKPTNILVYEGCVLLSDFGLCFDDSDNHLTGSNEVLGPSSIRPPEFENHRNDEFIDYKKSDVYLFAKTVWIMMKENTNGFRGEYNRKDPQIFLSKSDLRVKTLEPLHVMMENATKTNYFDRLDISDCMKYLQIQKSIVDGTVEESVLNKYLFDESIGYANTLEPDERVFYKSTSIFQVLKKLVDYSYTVNVDDYGKKYFLGKYIAVEDVSGNNDFRFTLYKNSFSGNKVIYLRIAELKLSSIGCKIKTTPFDQEINGYRKCSSVKDMIEPNNGNEPFSLDGSFSILFSI